MMLNKDTNVVEQDKNPVLGVQEMHPFRFNTERGRPASQFLDMVASDFPVADQSNRLPHPQQLVPNLDTAAVSLLKFPFALAVVRGVGVWMGLTGTLKSNPVW